MNARQAEILDRLKRHGEVSVRALARRFAVTAMTIRRDLDGLDAEGRLVRTHGGAIRSRAGIVEFAIAEKSRRRAAEKRAIGRAVAAMLRPGATLLLDTGTTTLEVARALAATEGLTVLTTSLAIAAALYPCENIDLVLLGGTMRKNSPDLSGFLTEENLRRFQVHWAVLGADAASKAGVYTTDLAVARCCAAMLACAKRKVLALDSSKFAARALFRYAQWRAFDAVVTDAGAPAAVKRWLRRAVPEFHFVPAR